ncbi:MAG TPA: class II aldolase/adducin family protein [Ktedonobacteraceae bacterium]
MTNFTENQAREQVVYAARMLFQSGVMSHSGHGNMSFKLPEGDRMLLTSGGVLANLTSEQLTVVTFDGEVIAGAMEPVTREIVAMHSCVYRARSDVNAVIHTHSPHVTGFALAHQPLPCAYEALLRFGVTEDIPVADWAPRGSQESAANIVKQIEQHPTVPAVLLGNHGLLAFGRDPLYAAMVIISMEEAAELTLAARTLGGEKSFPADALERERKHMQQFGSLR